MSLFKKILNNYTPEFSFRKWLAEYNQTKLLRDLQSGITVGIMLIPQAMAYAVIAGVPPVYGLYACIFPLIIYPFFGTSKHIAVGTVAIDMIIISASVSKIATPGSKSYILLVTLLAFMIGLIQIIMFTARLGFLINYLSIAVINGFTIAAALIIISGQLDNLLGIQIPQPAYFFETLKAVYLKINNIEQTTLLLGIGSIIMIALIKSWKPRFPTSLLIIIMGIFLGWKLELPQKGVHVVGNIPSGLPTPEVPHLSLSSIRQLLSTAITLALIQFMTFVTLGRTYANRNNYSIDSNQELLSLGLGNLINGFFHGLPASGSFSRSAVNEEAECKTPISNIFAAIMIVITLLFLTPLFYYLPYPSLAAVVIVAGFNLIDLKSLKYLYETKKRDFTIAIFTFLITIIIGIQEGIILGITVSLLAILYRQSKPNIVELGHLPGTRSFKDLERYPKAKRITKILILRIDASFSFANAKYFKDNLLKKARDKEVQIEDVLLDCSAVNDLDTTALGALSDIIDALKERQIKLYLTGIKGPVRDVMKKAGLYDKLGENKRIFRTPYRALVDILSGRDLIKESNNLGQHYKGTDKYADKDEDEIDQDHKPVDNA